MVEQSFAWLFNLDAEEELRHPGHHSPSPAMQSRMRSLARALRDVVLPGDVVVDEHTRHLDGTHVAQPWCPTRTALERLRQVGAVLPPFPSVDVLRQVNHRRFNASLGQTLPAAIYVDSLAALQRHVSEHPDRQWLLKRPFSFSGRHRLLCRLPTQNAHESQWIHASLDNGDGLQVEPWVERLLDTVVHGHCDQQGHVRLGEVAVQECDTRGAWVRTRLAQPGEIPAAQTRTLLHSAYEAARALRQVGYFGPFGVDSYLWQHPQDGPRWNPRSEINARYTMGWHIGMQGWRPAAPAANGV